jgi:hypothetical protein
MAELGITVIRPARKDEPDPGLFPAWLRQRIESVHWTLKGQLGLEWHHPASRPDCGRGGCCSACSP